MSVDLTVIRPPSPKFGINEIVYFRQSAMLGYIECAKVDSVYYDKKIGRNVYIFYYKKSKPDNQTVGDRINLKYSHQTIVTEDNLLNYQEALQLKATCLRNELIKTESQLQSTIGSPEIEVYCNDELIPDGDITPTEEDCTDFGNIQIGSKMYRNFKIVNSGTSDLVLAGSPHVKISGDDDFTVNKYPDITIYSGSYSVLTVVFEPIVIDRRVAVVIISSNAGLYDFAIEGFGI